MEREVNSTGRRGDQKMRDRARRGVAKEVVDSYLIRWTENNPLIRAVLWRLTH